MIQLFSWKNKKRVRAMMGTEVRNYQGSMVLLSLSHSVHSWLPSISLHLSWHIMHIENTRASQKMLLEEVLIMSMVTSFTTLLLPSVKMINLKKRKNKNKGLLRGRRSVWEWTAWIRWRMMLWSQWWLQTMKITLDFLRQSVWLNFIFKV